MVGTEWIMQIMHSPEDMLGDGMMAVRNTIIASFRFTNSKSEI